MAGARAEAGRALRKGVPRSSHAAWVPAAGRSPLDLLAESDRRRLPELVPLRHARMLASPFAFLRGAPSVMAQDLATTPVTGITVQACGDAHLLNFGLFATPERNLVFGLNDFDETLPGPWEWDVKRLATSLVVAARTAGFDQAVGHGAAQAAVRVYREQLARYAGMRLLEVWYSRVDASEIIALSRGRRRRLVAERLAQAQHHTNLDALPRLTEPAADGRRFVEDPPLLLQVKQATASVLEPHAGRSRYRHAGRRVVTGQRLLQTASDIFLGWTSDDAADYYVRQLWDMKGSVNLDTLDPADLAPYGRLCGWVLARAHARSGDAAAISGYLGGGDSFDRAVADFAEAYADQTEADHAAFTRARGPAPLDGARGGRPVQ
jgi:uncharacterized protein (DUF2252 family)